MKDPRVPANRLVLPLDVPDINQALTLAKTLSGRVGYFKIGLELFVAVGPQAVGQITDAAPDSGIFLDLKLHDIPATVARAMESTNDLPIDLITVHTQGGLEMMKAAVSRAGSALVLGVTILTSLDPKSLDELSEEYRQPGFYAARLAQRALISGCGGLVCSCLELNDLRARFGPSPLLVTPGIRPEWGQVAGDDQKRVGTIGTALASGADLLVIGRPIREAPDPLEACERVLEEIESALRQSRENAEPED